MDGHVPSIERLTVGRVKKPEVRVARPERDSVSTAEQAETSAERLLGTRDDVQATKDVQHAIDQLGAHEDFQAKYDRGIRERYESYHDQYVAVNVVIEARLHHLGIPITDWETCKRHPHKIGMTNRANETFGRDASRPFASLAAEYQRLRSKLDEEEALYASVCIRGGILKTPEKKKAKQTVKTEVVAADPARLFIRDELYKLAEDLALKAEEGDAEQVIADAAKLHGSVVGQLQKLHLPSEHTPENFLDHERRLVIQSLVRFIEKQLDLVRMKVQRDLDDLALKAELSRNVGNTVEEERYRAQLRQLLSEAAPLYLVDQGTRSPVVLDARMQYHLAHQWHYMREQWVERSRQQGGSITEAQQVNLDEGKVKVQQLLSEAYPYRRALSMAPIEAYARGA